MHQSPFTHLQQVIDGKYLKTKYWHRRWLQRDKLRELSYAKTVVALAAAGTFFFHHAMREDEQSFINSRFELKLLLRLPSLFLVFLPIALLERYHAVWRRQQVNNAARCGLSLACRDCPGFCVNPRY